MRQTPCMLIPRITARRLCPFGLYSAAHIPDDGRFVTSLYDCRFEPEDKIIESDIFLFSGMNQDSGNMQAVRARLKTRFPNAKSMIGGPICWSFDQAGAMDSLDGFDHIFIGDGEEEITKLLETLRCNENLDRICRTEKRFPIRERNHSMNAC